MFDNLINEYEQARYKLISKVRNSLEDHFLEVFNKYPEIKVIQWAQYTPYFNDGDTCEFYVNEFEVFDSFEIDYDNTKYASEYPSLLVINDFADSDIGSEIFKEMFGDHSIVSVTRDGVDIEWCDHD